VSAAAAVLGRELRLALRSGGGAGLGLAFFLIVVLLTPFGVGPDATVLARVAPGVLWIAALLACQLSLDRLFQSDAEDGTLDVLALAPLPLEALVALKALAHWLTTGLPLVLADLGRRGFRVMLAHPERVAEWQAAPEELGHLTAAGVLVQVTAAALTRPRRARSRRLAERALRAGWVHALASDAHGTDYRTPDLRPGLRASQRLLGARDAGWLVRVAPAAVLAGRELPPRAGASATGPDE